MPFDRDSFLKGVITGMRLPRTPGGQRPFSPVPSGMYILTESGEHVLTERVGSGLATFYPISKDPEDPSLFLVDAYSGTGITDPLLYSNALMEIKHYDKDGEPSTEDTQIFYWIKDTHLTPTITSKSIYCVFLWKNASADLDFYLYRAPSILTQTYGIIPGSYTWRDQLKQAGDYRYLVAPLAIGSIRDGEYYLRIKNAVMFEGTEDELAGFIANLSGMPMITEGG